MKPNTEQSYRDGGEPERPNPRPFVITEINQAGEFGWVTDDPEQVEYLKELKR